MLCIFFFRAEDGIRGLVRSRGLGDLYKGQVLCLGGLQLLPAVVRGLRLPAANALVRGLLPPAPAVAHGAASGGGRLHSAAVAQDRVLAPVSTPSPTRLLPRRPSVATNTALSQALTLQPTPRRILVQLTCAVYVHNLF